MAAGENKLKVALIVLAFILFSIFVLGLFYLATSPFETVTATLAFAAGLSMIALPCTLPLVFIIIPLSVGKGYKKGLAMATLFGIGLTITIALYGVAISFAGAYAGLDKATRIMWIVAGLAAFIFGLTELKLLKLKLPAIYKTPKFIEKQGDYVKSFFMGLLLGNAGVGCPNPAFYVLLTYLASVGSATTGLYLGLVHGIGRALPLIFFSILAIIGLNIVPKFAAKREALTKGTGWALILLGAFILTNGVFGHLWYETSIFHSGLNQVWAGASESLTEAEIPGFEGIEEPVPGVHLAAWILLALLIIPIFWHYHKERNAKELAWLLAIALVFWALMYPL